MSTKIWDVEKHKLVHTVTGPAGVTGVAFSPDDKRLATASIDGVGRIYSLDVDELLALALTRASRPFTEAECQEFFSKKQCPEEVSVLETVIDARRLANKGDLNGALAKVKKTKKLPPGVQDKLQVEIKRSTAPRLLEESTQCEKEGDLDKAVALLREAARRDPTLEASASYWNRICWAQSLAGKPAEALPACDKAILLYDYGLYRDSRGVARVLAGNRQGAIEDFLVYLKQSYDDPATERLKPKRQRWVKALRQGKNPLTPAELNELKKEY